MLWHQKRRKWNRLQGGGKNRKRYRCQVQSSYLSSVLQLDEFLWHTDAKHSSICSQKQTHTHINIRFFLRSPQVAFTHLFNSTPTPQTNPYMHTHTKKCSVTMNMKAAGPYQRFHLGSSLLFLSSSFWLSSPSFHHQVWNMKSAHSSVVDFALFFQPRHTSVWRETL